jgi:outer membrane protein assembly factor BamB
MRRTATLTLCLSLLACAMAPAGPSAQEILKASGVKGGLIVHVGCGDGTFTASLRVNDKFLVQGLDTDPTAVARAREHIRSEGLGGTVSAELFDGEHLPYADSLVNLVVVSSGRGQVANEEIERVLAPRGVVVLQKSSVPVPTGLSPLASPHPPLGEDWLAFRKPVPRDIDDWTHFLYDPQGTSVSRDRLAGHPRGLRWTGGPFWARSHEHTASLQAMVSANGRVFYVMDEGPVASIQLPAKMMLTARDAFNGVVLWKRELRDWTNPLFPLKSGPGWLPRRLVAVGDRVYLSPGIGQDLLCLDAATGKVLNTYKDTSTTFELIVSEGVILAAVDADHEACDYRQEHPNCWKEQGRASARWAWTRDGDTRALQAIQAESGKVLWSRRLPVAPMTLTADSKQVCFYDGAAVSALDRYTGKELWKTDVMEMKQIKTGYSGPRMIMQGDRILLSPMGQIVTLSAKTGDILWQVKGKPKSGHFSLEDFYVLGDNVWALQRGNQGAFTLYSLEDGTKTGEHRNPIKSFYIHQRCYPGRATERFQLPPMMGIQVYDMKEDKWFNNHWVRGGCIYGIMPANGMVYATPHACACYYQSKLNGFNALAPEPQPSEAPPPEARLFKGPAYASRNPQSAIRNPHLEDWSSFRHDGARSGYARTDVATDVNRAWKKSFGTKLSHPVVAGGKLFVCEVDHHTVHALDAATGKEAWHFVAGGRIDSPPTLYGELALFGCADGCVYALATADGRLAWKFRAAPNDRKMVSYGQIESVWPLSGSVLIQDGKLYCVAGRSMFLDGGLRMVVLDPETGMLVSENVMDRNVPGGSKQLDDLLMGKHMPVSMPDILSGDGKHVYMKSQTFTPDGKRVRVRPQRPDTQYDEEIHLFAPISFLDDAWHQRTYWIYGRAAGEGWAEFQFPPKRVPCGRILCIDADNAYSYGRDPELVCNTSITEHRLFCAARLPARKVGVPRLEGKWLKGKYPPTKNPLAANTVDWKQLSGNSPSKLSALDIKWVEEEPDVMARAMVLANDRLFVAGPRDVVDEKQMWGRSNDKAYQDKMGEQADWLSGKHGAVMQVFDKKDGKKLAEHELDSLPAFDGLIAARGNLYMVTVEGAVECYR